MSVRDPVCGRTIGISDVVANVDHKGWAYFFCSTECQLAFEADQTKFATERPTTPVMKDQTDNV